MSIVKNPAPIFIGIAGGSASGKTSIATSIARRFSWHVPIISQDWFYRELSDKSQGPTHNWDNPESFDVPLIVQTVQGWKNNIAQWTPRHDYANYKQLEKQELIYPAPVMIFEGLYTFHHPDVASLMDCKIFVDCAPDIALSRRIQRDVNERGHELRLILERYVSHVKPAYEKWVEPQKRKADLTIYNCEKSLDQHKGLDIIECYIRCVAK